MKKTYNVKVGEPFVLSISSCASPSVREGYNRVDDIGGQGLLQKNEFSVRYLCLRQLCSSKSLLDILNAFSNYGSKRITFFSMSPMCDALGCYHQALADMQFARCRVAPLRD